MPWVDEIQFQVSVLDQGTGGVVVLGVLVVAITVGAIWMMYWRSQSRFLPLIAPLRLVLRRELSSTGRRTTRMVIEAQLEAGTSCVNQKRFSDLIG